MKFEHAKARQPEIIRSTQRDLTYTTDLSEGFSELLRITGPRNWIRYNHLCKLIAEIVYHGFASINNLQTLGEEYTGIIQVNNTYVSLPSKLAQLTAIILQFGGEALYNKVLTKFEKEIHQNEDLRPEAREKLVSLISFMKSIVPYINTLHKTIFYFYPSKYHLSKRLTGINYILIRRWLHPNQGLYGYRILGFVTFIQLIISLALNLYQVYQNAQKPEEKINKYLETTREKRTEKTVAPSCGLCLEPRRHTSLTPCGHLFCWDCIMEWLDEKDECPVCREYVKKPNVVILQNYL